MAPSDVARMTQVVTEALRALGGAGCGCGSAGADERARTRAWLAESAQLLYAYGFDDVEGE
ncbi:hypothetical protein E2651_04570 [Streptomyces sp. MZ04]|nr:hypothetical protein E2651_04570 [Streptomyces sp. MZ04]